MLGCCNQDINGKVNVNMVFWTSIICIFAIIFLIYYKKINVPSVFFFLLWVFVMVLASLQLFDVYEASMLMSTNVGIGCLSFGLGCVFYELFLKHSPDKRVEQEITVMDNNIGRDRLLIFIFTMTALIASIVLMAAISAYMAGFDMKSLRYDSVLADFLIIPVDVYSFAYLLLLKPVTILSIPIACMTFNIGKRLSDYRYQLFMLYFLLVDILTTGSRYDIVYLGICIWFTLSIRKREFKHFFRKTWKWGKRLLWMVPVLLIVVSFVRKSEDLARTFYTYLSGCIPYASILLDNGEIINNASLPLFGIMYPVTFILKQLHLISNYPDFIYEATAITDVVQGGAMISPEIGYNAFVSPIYHLYISGGYIADVLGMALLGILCMAIYRKAMRTNLMWDWVSYLMIMIAIFKTIQLYPFVDTAWSIGFMLCLFFSLKNKKIVIKKKVSCDSKSAE